MPFINGRFYMNPAYGRAVELARDVESQYDAHSNQREPSSRESGDHWITKDGRHILIHESQTGRQQRESPKPKVFEGDATYYNLRGHKTASGRPFDPNQMTAAMSAEKAKLGQIVTVTYSHPDQQGNEVTKSINVLVNDRGPFARNPNGLPVRPLAPDPNGVIDLTPAAFRQLTGSLKSGRVHVTVTVPDE